MNRPRQNKSLSASNDPLLLELLGDRTIRFFLFVATLIAAQILTWAAILIDEMTRTSFDNAVSALPFVTILCFITSLSFPHGYYTFLPHFMRGYPYDYMNQVIILGWFIYLGIIISAVLTNRRRIYFFLYKIFLVLLIINMAGTILDPFPGGL